MQQFSVVLNQLIGMGVMLAVGAVCVRTKLLNEESLQGICRLILNVGIPMLVFSNAISGTTRADLFASAAIIGITILLYALLIASMWLLAKLLRLPGERGRMFQGAFIFGNAGFIGLPLVLALFPKHGALYFALMSLTDQLFLWTYGVWITKPRSNRQTFADEHPATSLGGEAPWHAESRAGRGDPGDRDRARRRAGAADRNSPFAFAGRHLHAIVHDLSWRPVHTA